MSKNGLLVSWGETLTSLKWASDLPNDLLLAQLDVRQAHLSLCWPFTPPLLEPHQSLPPSSRLSTKQTTQLNGDKEMLTHSYWWVSVTLNLLSIHNLLSTNMLPTHCLFLLSLWKEQAVTLASIILKIQVKVALRTECTYGVHRQYFSRLATPWKDHLPDFHLSGDCHHLPDTVIDFTGLVIIILLHNYSRYLFLVIIFSF